MKILMLVKNPPAENLPPPADLQYISPTGQITGGWLIIGPAPAKHHSIIELQSTPQILHTIASNPDHLFLALLEE